LRAGALPQIHLRVINDDGVAYIEAAACQGCGICASLCPRKAIKVQHYSDKQVTAKSAALAAR
jgi:heterodisulfide reductase subunit A-like polyferredoxin